MNMDINLFRGIATAILLFAFVGMWIWAWRPARKSDFEEAANLPLKEDDK